MDNPFYVVDSFSSFYTDLTIFRLTFDSLLGLDHSIPPILCILTIVLACWLVRIIVGVFRR